MPDPSPQPALPAPDDIEAWVAAQKAREALAAARSQPVLDRLQPSVSEMNLSGVSVLDVRPRGWKDNGKVMAALFALINLHRFHQGKDKK